MDTSLGATGSVLNNYPNLRLQERRFDMDTSVGATGSVLNNYPILRPLKQASSFLVNSFYENSIFFAANNEAISNSANRYKDLSWTQKFKLGLVMGAKRIIPSIIILTALSYALSYGASGKQSTFERPTMMEGIQAAIIEEILFRGILQNCLAVAQKIARFLTPQILQNNRVFQFATSPSARIIGVNSLFASIHLSNTDHLTTQGAIIQTLKIFILPSQGILHETTGNIIAPLSAHLANNIIIRLL